MRRVAVLAVLAGLMGTTATPAAAEGPLTASLRIAQDFWGVATPADCVSLHARSAHLPARVIGSILTPVAVGGMHCEIVIAHSLRHHRTYRSRIRACSVLVHEFGHLLGHGHSADSESIMFRSEQATVRACYDRFIGRNARRDRRVYGDHQWAAR